MVLFELRAVLSSLGSISHSSHKFVGGSYGVDYAGQDRIILVEEREKTFVMGSMQPVYGLVPC